MATARSSPGQGMWNVGWEGGTYVYAQAKMGASFMFQTWRRGLVCLLVLVLLPGLAPLIILSVMVGSVFLVPVLCGVAAYYVLFRPATLSKIIKWFRSPKSVLSSEPQSTELAMEAFHVDDQEREDQLMHVESPDKDPLHHEFPILEITPSGIPLEELNLPADKDSEPSQVEVVDNRLEEPEQLEEGLPEEAPEEGLPVDPAAAHVVTEDEAPIVTPEPEGPIGEVEVTKQAEAGPTTSEVSAGEAQIVLPSQPIVEASGVEDSGSTSTGLEPEASVIAVPAEEAIQVQKPEPPAVEARVHVAEAFIEEKGDKASEAEVLINEPEVTTDALPASVGAPDVRGVELPLAVSEGREELGVEESLAVPKLQLEAAVVAEQNKKKKKKKKKKNKNDSRESSVCSSVAHKPLPVEEAQVEAAPVEETLEKKVGEPEASAVEKIELERFEGHDRISSDLEPPSNVEDSMAVVENLGQVSKDRTIKFLNLELEDSSLTPVSSSSSQRRERGNEADEDVEENLEKNKAVDSSQAEESVFVLKPGARVRRQISFENVRAKDEVNIGASPSPSHRTDVRTGVQGTNFVFKSRLGYDHRAQRHSAPEFLATQTWVREAPLYSPQDSFRSHKKAKSNRKWPGFEGARPSRTFSASVSEPQMGEFESLLQSWQERGKATDSPTRESPSGSPRSLAESGRQIRDEINTIQKIIGQEIPPQYSLWNEVETLCQIVGMDLPYMGDVSDMTKARQGLDLLKVVVGIK